MLVYSTDIPNIKYSVQYCMPKDKLINMLWQQFGRAVYGSGLIGEAIFLIKDWYKGLCEDIACPVKSCGCTCRAF